MTTPAERSVVDRARRLVEEGHVWQARDLLEEHVASERDTEALTALGEVLHAMGDLPRAGAVWFAAGAKGPEVDGAVAAWREQTGEDFVAMWRSLPASARREPRPRRIEALRERARSAQGAGADSQDGGDEGRERADVPDLPDDEAEGVDGAWLTAWVLAVLFVVLAVIGFVTVLGWVVPG
ncbi:hypothetical protein [Oryzobacter terrae]|uniref:hypothetical protein n=1 Tax=Oryzobacter terrae TaxID=1620385 RepID=UPI00366B0113